MYSILVNQRQVQSRLWVLLLCVCPANANEGAHAVRHRPKASFRVLYSNDFTNTSCVSPFNLKGDRRGWTPAKLQATVDETAGIGVDVHLLQPAHCWVPWWPSKIYPMEEHYRWWRKRFGRAPTRPVHEYIRQGGDPLRVFVERCRARGLKPFISFRLNDGHHLENAFGDARKAWGGRHTICRFYVEHPEYMLGAEPAQTYSRVRLLQNWAIDAVRDYKFRLIQEICENHDIDGIELDYLRHPGYFRQDQTTSQQRADIMTGFVKRVRAVLDRTAKPSTYRWLCVRVPCYVAFLDPMGIDLPRMTQAGVDMVNVSASYFTIQQNDMGAIKRLAPDKSVYLELCHTTRLGKRTHAGYDSIDYRRTTDHQYYTAARLAYARGLDGISLFNFVYYREHGRRDRGPFHEPPFHVIRRLSDPTWLAQQPQHYIWRVNQSIRIGQAGRSPRLQNAQFPEAFTAGHRAVWPMDLAPPDGGWHTDGILRIEADQSLEGTAWQAQLNGRSLEPTSHVHEPYPTPYRSVLGEPEGHRGWILPKDAVRDGGNEIRVTMASGPGSKRVVFVDISIH